MWGIDSHFFGERDQPLHHVQAPLITERREQFRTGDVGVLLPADPAGKHALTDRPQARMLMP